jgi:hypothetical protein
VTAHFFGERWDSPRIDHSTQVETPIGRTCPYCSEPIVEGDRGVWTTAGAMHAECELLRGVGHTFGVCTCTGFDMTSRAAARELWNRVEVARGVPW